MMTPESNGREWRLLVHGGCGAFERSRVGEEKDRAFRQGLDRALEAGERILDAGGSALEAVEASVCRLEDDPLFNAGRGSVLTLDGRIEMDAAIMDGADLSAGAVNGVTATRNPVRLARAVMEKSPHVFLGGEGADLFSREQGLEQASPDYFETAERRRQLDRMRRDPEGRRFDSDVKYGTVGAVARDARGHVAAATSTGGLTGKKWGRIGDSPVIGAGTFADDRRCAVSATGSGEFFLRIGVAHEIAARIGQVQALASGDAPEAWLRFPRSDLRLDAPLLQRIVDSVLDEVARIGGSGGVIVVTPFGDPVTSFNTAGMHRGMAGPAGRWIALYGDEGPVPTR